MTLWAFVQKTEGCQRGVCGAEWILILAMSRAKYFIWIFLGLLITRNSKTVNTHIALLIMHYCPINPLSSFQAIRNTRLLIFFFYLKLWCCCSHLDILICLSCSHYLRRNYILLKCSDYYTQVFWAWDLNVCTKSKDKLDIRSKRISFQMYFSEEVFL